MGSLGKQARFGFSHHFFPRHDVLRHHDVVRAWICHKDVILHRVAHAGGVVDDVRHIVCNLKRKFISTLLH